MPENTIEPTGGVDASRQVCVHTRQITDSCLDKDCVEDLRVYLTQQSQAALDNSTSVKTRCAELLFANVCVEPLHYKAGFYAVDLTFYYRIIGDAILCGTRPTTITGIAIFAKRVVLYGGHGRAKIFTGSDTMPTAGLLQRRDMPEAVLEALDPMILSAKVREVCECHRGETELADIPACIAESFGEPLVMTGESKRLYVTIGQFSTVRLEREPKLTLPVCEYCAPTRECCDEECCEEDPCEMFSRIDFPMRAFFPESRGANCKEEPPEPQSCSC